MIVRLILFIVMLSSVADSRTCPSPFTPYNRGCYALSEDVGNVSECQSRICGGYGGTLVSIDNVTFNGFLLEMLRSRGDSVQSAFIGLYERGEDESGDWVWSDGLESNFTMWAVGEPNNWCLDEDCAVLGHGEIGGVVGGPGGWFDLSCGEQRHCFCQLGGNISSDFRWKESNMTNANKAGSYAQCLGKAKQCWWFENKLFQYMVVAIGIPCAFITLYTLAATTIIGFGCCVRRPVVRDHVSVALSSLYGGLLSEPSSTCNRVDDIVDRWVVRGAWGSIFYGVGLLFLAFSTLLHVNRGISYGFAIDTLEAFIMFICKIAVAFSAILVHWYLSPRSRAIAEWWVLILAASKFATAICTLILVVGYAMAALRGGIGSLCMWGYSFCWTLIASLICECIAALALCRLQQRAVAHAGDPRVFSDVIGCSWLLLVGGTLGAGLGMGIVAALFVFDGSQDHAGSYRAFGFFYLGAAVCQLFAGAAMLRANAQLRKYFGVAAGALPSEEGFDTDTEVNLEMSTTLR